MEQKYTATLYLYDLSNGMAKTFAPMFIGKSIEAIWHSSINVYGKEFYFSGGICYDNPKTTAFGTPIKEIPIGQTEISPTDFQAYLKAIKGQFQAENYHIFNNNCNHFTNNISEFLVGKGIPDYILNQSKEYQNTPIGKMMEGFQVNLNNNNNNYQGMGMPNQQNSNVQTHAPDPNVHPISDLVNYMEIITGNDRVVMDFYANWCGPCKMIKPIFSQMAGLNRDSIKFCNVNVDTISNKELCMNLNIKAMPTFIAFYRGEEVERIRGANKMKLEQMVKNLKNK